MGHSCGFCQLYISYFMPFMGYWDDSDASSSFSVQFMSAAPQASSECHQSRYVKGKPLYKNLIMKSK